MSDRSKANLRQLDKRTGAVREPTPPWGQAVLCFTRHLAEGLVQAIRQKNRIVSETLVTARRPYELSCYIGRKLFQMSIWPSDTQCRYEMGSALSRHDSIERSQFRLDEFHGSFEISMGTGPARRVDARLATECVYRQT
jgi:hypothetical protein